MRSAFGRWRVHAALVVIAAVMAACGGGDTAAPLGPTPQPPPPPLSPPPPLNLKPLPRGAFVSLGPVSAGQDVFASGSASIGALLAVPWNLCDTDCLVATIQTNLDSALQHGRQAALVVVDAASQPDALKATCTLLSFENRNGSETACVAWDPNYLAAKKALVRTLGEHFDSHAALAYVYFTGAASTNGAEGHWRVKESTVRALGYTPEVLALAYADLFAEYRNAFPRTPLAFEAHGQFLAEPGVNDGADPALWNTMWAQFGPSGRVGVAAWWCAERMSVNGRETTSIWSIVQDAAARSFTVCQTVASFTKEPWRFSDAALGLDYGSSNAYSSADSTKAFTDTMDWAQGLAAHAGQGAPIHRFAVLEPWLADANNAAFKQRIEGF